MPKPPRHPLLLRRVKDTHKVERYRVVLEVDETEFELGSIGITFYTDVTPVWRWGIDTVIPMRDTESAGEGRDRADCMKLFRSAWEKFAADPARLTEFLEAKRRARRS